mmetsp:Transcript_26240/g.47591  ORF Transcript_26240/g.47591 Transcript_26240/m.47591 type:complete len:98 (+) Transcript_26240:553-846(+)
MHCPNMPIVVKQLHSVGRRALERLEFSARVHCALVIADVVEAAIQYAEEHAETCREAGEHCTPVMQGRHSAPPKKGSAPAVRAEHAAQGSCALVCRA